MEAPPLERKLVAILAADVEGYSRMMHEDEEGALAILSSHRTIIDDLIAAGRGEVSGTAGDSVLAEFASVTDAFRAAIAIQRALHRANADLPEERKMRLRIGLNVGDVMVKDNDIFGDGVNIAARLESLAEPGGICVTRGVRDHLRDRVEDTFDDMGEHAVKNIARPVRAFRVVFDPEGVSEVPADAPGRPRPVLASAPAAPSDSVEIAFWQSVQESGDALEYRAYLDRYPDGAFAPLAEARIEAEATAAPSAVEPYSPVELAFWDSVKGSDNPAMIRAYLDRYPDGAFAPLAQIRLGEFEPRSPRA